MAHIGDPSYLGLMWVRGTAVGVFGLLSVGCATPCVDDGFLAMQHDPSCMATGAPTTTSGESTSSATTSAVTTSGTDTASSTTAATTGPGTATTDATGTGTGSTTDASTGSTSAVSASTTDGTSTGGPSSGSSTTLDPMGDDDGDAVPNGVEQMFGTDPNDRDSDDDGILDGTEFVNTDLDNDGLIVPLDPDSDDDGLLDGTEVGTACDDPDTDPAICVADADPGANNTNPQDPDSDAGGASDGSEDRNLNGKRDMGETDNTLGDDDASGLNADGDGDGLSDSLETFLGSDPQDSDSDDDGVEDGLEKNRQRQDAVRRGRRQRICHHPRPPPRHRLRRHPGRHRGQEPQRPDRRHGDRPQQPRRRLTPNSHDAHVNCAAWRATRRRARTTACGRTSENIDSRAWGDAPRWSRVGLDVGVATRGSSWRRGRLDLGDRLAAIGGDCGRSVLSA